MAAHHHGSSALSLHVPSTFYAAGYGVNLDNVVYWQLKGGDSVAFFFNTRKGDGGEVEAFTFSPEEGAPAILKFLEQTTFDASTYPAKRPGLSIFVRGGDFAFSLRHVVWWEEHDPKEITVAFNSEDKEGKSMKLRFGADQNGENIVSLMRELYPRIA